MADMVYPLSEQWSDDDGVKRQNLNRMRADAQYLGKVKKLNKDNDGEGDPQAVNLGTFLERYIFNCRPELLGTTQIRVPFTADRPPTIMINGFMLQAEADVDSPVYSGGADTIYILAIRTVDSTTFTIALRTSPSEGTDERLIGQVAWDSAAFDSNLLITYELEGFGLQHTDAEIVKAWVAFTGSTGVILDSHDVTSVVRNSTGDWTITWETDFVDTTYAIVVTSITSEKSFANIQVKNANNCDVRCFNSTGSLLDAEISVIAIGAQA